ncbi:hypothetical protein [Plantactinospora sp. WMMB782]|uniref:hypothetical protein n=1 Tax=Plantactinospora sp. WMMB782 TaxID=3404121 RepID=UPI003B93753A
MPPPRSRRRTAESPDGFVVAPLRQPAAGLPENGLPENGLPENGLPENGLPENGLPENGLPENGLPENGSGPVACATGPDRTGTLVRR